jgi:putative Holliday junction resolvase
MITADPAAFRAASPLGRLAGLDVGTKTIGLATCDATRSFVTARHTLKRAAKFAPDLAALADFVRAEQLTGLVVGLPLSMDGTDTPRTQSVRAFARNLAPLTLPILLWDERWSTQAVQRAMIDADVSRAKRAAAVDMLAAAHILEGAVARLAYLPDSSADA